MERRLPRIAGTRRWILRLAVLLVCIAIAAPVAWSDGGQLRGSEASGPFVLSLYTSPIPLRPGPSEITTLITERETGVPVLNAAVSVRLEVEGQPETLLVREAALGGDGLRYFVTPKLPQSGNWKVRVEAKSAQGQGSLVLTLPVEEALPIALTVWPALAFPPVAIALFVLNQRLRKRMSRPRREIPESRPAS